MFCSKCGKQIDDDSKFCPFCGNTVMGSPVQKETKNNAATMQEKVQGETTEKQKTKKPVSIKFAVGGTAVVLVLVIVSFFMFRPSKSGRIEDSFLGKMFSLSWGEISDMSARDFRNLLKEEDILHEYEEGSALNWSLHAKETSGFMGSNTVYGVEFDSMTYDQIFIMLYETREDCKDSYDSVKGYLDKNLVKNTAAVDLLSIGGRLNFGGMFDIVGDSDELDVRDCYGYLVDISSKEEDLNKYLELYLNDAEQKGKEFSDEEREELRKNVEESVIYKKVVLMRADVEHMSDIQELLSFDDTSYSKSFCLVTVTFELRKETLVDSAFAMMGWDALAGKEIDIEKVKASLDADFQQVFEKDLVSYSDRFSSFLGETADLDVREYIETASYSALYMMEKHNFDALQGRYIDKKDKNFWYITNFNYDMDKGKAVDLSKYMNSANIYCAVEYNYDVRNSEKFASDLDREICLAMKGYDLTSGEAIDFSGYMNSAKIYCAARYNYDVDEESFFESDLDRVIYLADKDYNMETGGTFSSNDEKRLWLMINYGYDIVAGKAGKAVDKRIGEALLAYQRCMNDGIDTVYNVSDSNGNLMNYADDDVSWCLIYIDDDDVPELLLRFGVMIDTYNLVLSYHNDNVVTNIVEGEGSTFSYAEKRNIFCVSEGRMGYYSDIFYNLIDGEVVTLAEGRYNDKWENNGYVMNEYGSVVEEYFWNHVECSGDDYANAINNLIDSAGGATEWVTAPSYRESYPDILSAYDALRTTTYTAYVPQIAEFEISNGILNASTNDGSRYGWVSRNPFSISYPVADDCVWERGYYLDDFVHEGDTDYESVRGIILSDQEYYEELIKENGEEWFLEYRPIDSPVGIHIEVMDGVVVRVYSTSS